MKDLSSTAPAAECTGHCQGCGKVHIKVFGAQEASVRQLRENVALAVEATALDAKIVEVSEPAALQMNGVQSTPALMIEGELVSQGTVPSAEEIATLLRNHPLLKGKLYQLRHVTVGVDTSEGSGSALRFAWEIAKKAGAAMEVVYAMDSIFEGVTPSASGFLSNYQKTMQTELENFVTDELKKVGVQYTPPSQMPKAPAEYNDGSNAPAITTKVVFGFPDTALEEASRHTDLIVLGTAGRGTLGQKWFGSVSTEVSKLSHCPVLLVPPEAEFRGLHNMLYASNFDSLDDFQIRQATGFARRFEGQIHFVHVGPAGEKNLDTERRVFEANYRDLALPEKPFLFVKMVSDNVLDALYEYAFYHRIEMLVFVTHQRHFWDGILHKSITRQAVATSDLPILVMHSDDDIKKT